MELNKELIMINTFTNITVTRNHKVIINNIPLNPGEIVDVIVVPKKDSSSIIDLPLAGMAVELKDPFDSAIEEDDWRALN